MRALLTALLVVIASLPILSAAGCAGAPGDGLTVFAASSLRGPLEEVGRAYEEAHPGTRVTFAFDGSDRLRLQLEQGARADVFASADTVQMEMAEKAGLLTGEPVVFAENRLALVVPHDNPAGIQDARDLARPGVRLVLAAPEVPAGAYARRLLALLDGTYGEGFGGRVLANVVSHEQNVKAVLAKVELGEADAGLVYATDVTDGVREVPVPGVERLRAEYSIAVLEDARHGTEADAFLAFVLSEEGQAVLARHGFLPAE